MLIHCNCSFTGSKTFAVYLCLYLTISGILNMPLVSCDGAGVF